MRQGFWVFGCMVWDFRLLNFAFGVEDGSYTINPEPEGDGLRLPGLQAL